MGFTFRPLDKGDVPAVARVLAEAEAVDDTGEHYNEGDVEEEFANPDLDLGKDIIGAFDGDELVGYTSVMARKSLQDRKAFGFGVTLPNRRGEGLGTQLVELMLARAAEVRQLAEPAMRLLVSGVATNTAQAELLTDAGFKPDRWSFAMRVELGAVPPAPPIPPGYAVRTYEDADADRWLEVHNRAFADHPNFNPWQPSEWQQWVIGSRAFRPRVSFLVTPEGSPEEIVAYIQTSEYDAFTEVTGRREAYVGKVGTVPEHRGRGLASWLLHHCLTVYQVDGYHEASLDVDSLNPTGALGIYERAGFETERTFVTYERTFT